MESMQLGNRPKKLPESVFVHPLSCVESATIGEKTRVWAFAHVMDGAVIGERCNVGDHAFVESGARIGSGVTIKNGISIWDCVEIQDDVFLGPHMVFTNDMRPRAFIKHGRDQFLPTVVERGATIGAGAVIVCGSKIGPYAFVAAGAVVTKDVPAHGFVRGNPARLVGYVCKCATTTFPLHAQPGSPQACSGCGTRAAELSNRSP